MIVKIYRLLCLAKSFQPVSSIRHQSPPLSVQPQEICQQPMNDFSFPPPPITGNPTNSGQPMNQPRPVQTVIFFPNSYTKDTILDFSHIRLHSRKKWQWIQWVLRAVKWWECGRIRMLVWNVGSYTLAPPYGAIPTRKVVLLSRFCIHFVIKYLFSQDAHSALARIFGGRLRGNAYTTGRAS